VEIHQLVYFVAVAETGGFSRAAERCNVAQPSLSQQVIKLEQELGCDLFERVGRKTVLTDAGRALLPRARDVLSGVQSIKTDLQTGLESGRGALSVGFIPTIAPFVLPQVVRRFHQRFPQAVLAVSEDLTANLVRGLIESRLDVAIMSLPLHNRLIEARVLLTEALVAASAPGAHLPGSAAIHVQDLERHPFIALSEMHCLGEQVSAFCSQQNVDLKVVCSTTQLSTVQSCVALGLGVSLVPAALAASDSSGQVAYRPLSGAAPQRKIVAGTRAGRSLSRLAEEFIEMVRAEYPAG